MNIAQAAFPGQAPERSDGSAKRCGRAVGQGDALDSCGAGSASVEWPDALARVDASMKLNDTACTLLGFLHDRPMTGWDLAETVQLTIGQFWNVSRSQVYRELKTLEQEGCVVGGDRGQREKRHYSITEDGRLAFRDWISREPGEEIARYPMLVTVWFGDHLEDEDLGWALRVHYARHRKRLEFLKQVDDETLDQTTPAARALRFGRMYEQAVVEWFETLPWFGGVEDEGPSPGEPRPSKPKRPADHPARFATDVLDVQAQAASGKATRKKASKKRGAKKASPKKAAKKKAAKKRTAKNRAVKKKPAKR